jgi:hypothetical protein
MADRYEENSRGFNEVFRSRDGPVGRDLSERATKVELAAKRQVNVRTGFTKRSIHKSWVGAPGSELRIRIGSDAPPSLLIHEGAPPHDIVPVNAQFLRFEAKDGTIVFTKHVHHPGVKPNRYLTDNLPLAVAD